jgi:histidyl-tRNA synthetase
VQQRGGQSTPGVGFAMGLARLVVLRQETGALSAVDANLDAYVVSVGSDAQRAALAQVEQLRSGMPDLNMLQHTGGGSFKSQLKKADKSAARVALIWGEDEVAAGTVTLKPLRESDGERQAQQTVPVEQLQAVLTAVLASDTQ